MRSKNFETVWWVAVVVFAGCAVKAVRACGPDFPNNLLDSGEAAVLVAPVADFEKELERMHLLPGTRKVPPPWNDTSNPAEQTLAAELKDLELALQTAGTGTNAAREITAQHGAERGKLNRYLKDHDRWAKSGQWVWDESGGHRTAPLAPEPAFPVLVFARGLPAEFADYFEGSGGWWNPGLVDKSMARQAWERLLARPAAERHYKSTWAAFMLGRSWEETDPEKAAQYFRQVRTFTKQGFADSLDLVTASLGREARLAFKRSDFKTAIQLYLEQGSRGDHSAIPSLQIVAAAALAATNHLPELAAQPTARNVITAYLISCARSDVSFGQQKKELAAGWLAAVEAAGVNDLKYAESLALASYQAGDFKRAERWIKLSEQSAVSQWLQAKLFLRAGDVASAAECLSRVTQELPVYATIGDGDTLANNLVLNHRSAWYGPTTPGQQALGELGALRLAQRDYTEALDALLRSGYWMDAAYVAERVLTTDELKAYVDQTWGSPRDAIDEESRSPNLRAAALRQQIRSLLARRLTRDLRGSEAREYVDPELRPQHDAFMQALEAGWNEQLPTTERARWLFEAGRIARFEGMELMGTETAPDWHIHGGGFQFGVTVTNRAATRADNAIAATDDELQRARAHHPDPDARFHYRFQGAFLGWEAARLLPDNSDETAVVLCRSGSWIKYLDPPTADIFYKALVNRCRQTAIGDQADSMRWFPVLDEDGNPKPWPSRATEGL